MAHRTNLYCALVICLSACAVDAPNDEGLNLASEDQDNLEGNRSIEAVPGGSPEVLADVTASDFQLGARLASGESTFDFKGAWGPSGSEVKARVTLDYSQPVPAPSHWPPGLSLHLASDFLIATDDGETVTPIPLALRPDPDVGPTLCNKTFASVIAAVGIDGTAYRARMTISTVINDPNAPPPKKDCTDFTYNACPTGQLCIRKDLFGNELRLTCQKKITVSATATVVHWFVSLFGVNPVMENCICHLLYPHKP